MDVEQFVPTLVSFTKQYLQQNPDHPYSDNIDQYKNVRRVLWLLSVYKTIVAQTSGRVLDVGSGIGLAKVIDPHIYTANLPVDDYFNQGTADYFSEVEEFFNIERDYICRDCAVHSRWIETDQLFDSIILHRFLPWDDTVTKKTLVNIFTEIYRLLSDSGVLIYTPINIDRLDTNRWERLNFKLPTFKITKQQLYDTINTYKVL